MFRLKTAIGGGRAVEGFPEEVDTKIWEKILIYGVVCRTSIKMVNIFVVPEVLFMYRKHTNAVSSSSRAMNDRMRHIKSNLRRRRNELADQKFIEYMASLTRWERIKNFFHDLSTDYYKQAGFNFVRNTFGSL